MNGNSIQGLNKYVSKKERLTICMQNNKQPICKLQNTKISKKGTALQLNGLLSIFFLGICYDFIEKKSFQIIMDAYYEI